MPNPGPRRASSDVADWRSVGIEIAQPLFSTTNTTGALNTAAKLNASLTAPCDIAPSPKLVRVGPGETALTRIPRGASSFAK